MCQESRENYSNIRSDHVTHYFHQPLARRSEDELKVGPSRATSVGRPSAVVMTSLSHELNSRENPPAPCEPSDAANEAVTTFV